MYKVPREAILSQITALIPVYMNVVMMGCLSGWLPNAIYFLLAGEEVYATPAQCATIASCSELGRIMCALPAGILADKYGRRKVIISTALLHLTAWVGLSLSTSIITIYIGRFILGVAMALVNATALASIGEIASPEIRGQLTSLYQIAQNGGIMLPAIISALFSQYKVLAWGILLFAINNVVCLYWITETPNFLVSVSKMEEAKRVLQKIRRGYRQNEIDDEFEKLKKYIENEKATRNKQSWFKFVKSKSIRTPLLTGFLMNFLCIGTGGHLLRSYVTVIIPPNDYIPKRYYPLMSQGLALLIATSTALYIDKFGRKKIFLFGATSMLLTNVVCAIANYFYIEQNTETFFKPLFMVGNVLMVFFYGASILPISSAIKSELYPQAVKGLCGSLGIISQASSTIILYQLYNLMKVHFHAYFIYIICSFNCFLLCLLICFLLPEGRGASLTDVQMQFNEEEPAPCEQVKVQKNSS